MVLCLTFKTLIHFNYFLIGLSASIFAPTTSFLQSILCRVPGATLLVLNWIMSLFPLKNPPLASPFHADKSQSPYIALMTLCILPTFHPPPPHFCGLISSLGLFAAHKTIWMFLSLGLCSYQSLCLVFSSYRCLLCSLTLFPPNWTVRFHGITLHKSQDFLYVINQCYQFLSVHNNANLTLLFFNSVFSEIDTWKCYFVLGNAEVHHSASSSRFLSSSMLLILPSGSLPEHNRTLLNSQHFLMQRTVVSSGCPTRQPQPILDPYQLIVLG